MSQAFDYRIDSCLLTFEDGESMENYTAVFPKPFRKVEKIQLMYGAFSKTVYHTTGVVTFQFEDNINGTWDVTMPARAYASGTELASELETQLQAKDANYTATYSASTGKLTISNTATVGITSMQITNVIYPFDCISGFLGTETGVTSLTSSSVVDISWPRALGVRVSAQDCPVMGVQSTAFKYTYHIPMANTNFGQVQTFTNNADWDQHGVRLGNHPDFDSLKIEWLYPDGSQMPAGAFNGGPHEFIFRVTSMTGRGY